MLKLLEIAIHLENAYFCYFGNFFWFFFELDGNLLFHLPELTNDRLR